MMKRYTPTLVPDPSGSLRSQDAAMREDEAGKYVKLLDFIPFGLVDRFLHDVKSEVLRARAKFPSSDASMTALTEEVGELAEALLDRDSSGVMAEAMQVAAMAVRIALEGDPTLDNTRRARGAGPHPGITYGGALLRSLSPRKVVYISHRLSGDREANRKAALEWVSWAGNLGFAVSATWVALAEVWDEKLGRELGLQLDCALVERCDMLFECGPELSSGMATESEHASRHGVTVFNFLGKTFEEAEEFLRDFGVIE